MKKMFSKLAILLTLIVSLSFVLGACNNNTPVNPNAKSITVHIGDKSFSLDTEKEFVGQVLEELKEKGKITYVAENGQYGMFIKEIDELKPVGNQFIALYSTIEDEKYSYTLMTTTILDKTFYSSNYGADSLPLFNGAHYAFVLDSYEA